MAALAASAASASEMPRIGGSRLVSEAKTLLSPRFKELEDCIDKSIQRPPLCYQRPFSNTPKWDTRLKKCPIPNCDEYFCGDSCKSNMLNGPTCRQHKCQPAHNRAWWLANLYTLMDRFGPSATWATIFETGVSPRNISLHILDLYVDYKKDGLANIILDILDAVGRSPCNPNSEGISGPQGPKGIRGPTGYPISKSIELTPIQLFCKPFRDALLELGTWGSICCYQHVLDYLTKKCFNLSSEDVATLLARLEGYIDIQEIIKQTYK